MSVQFLQTKDFEVENEYLKTKLGGFALILFYTTDCPHCKPIIPLFHNLPSLINGCKFALVNIRGNRSLVGMSKETKVPLEFVPSAILYYNHLPYRRYNQPYTADHIQKFLEESAKKINQFKNEPAKDKEKVVPPYALGVPVCDEESGVCYLSFDSAYGKRDELKTPE
jgi:thiol-disulfide isomerase/thioredoxin